MPAAYLHCPFNRSLFDVKRARPIENPPSVRVYRQSVPFRSCFDTTTGLSPPSSTPIHPSFLPSFVGARRYVLQAGHMVPADQPAMALAMVADIIGVPSPVT